MSNVLMGKNSDLLKFAIRSETAVANVRPRKIKPRRENPEVNKRTSPTPNKNDAMHSIGKA